MDQDLLIFPNAAVQEDGFWTPHPQLLEGASFEFRARAQSLTRSALKPQKAEATLQSSRSLPAKLQRLQPLNIFALIRDDLRLPDQADAHRRHHQQADHENNILLRLGSSTVQLQHV
jgi:hypothetical protein